MEIALVIVCLFFICIEMEADTGGRFIRTTTCVVSKTLKLATQNVWGNSTSVVLDYFNRIDVDVLCAQECSKLSESDIKAQGGMCILTQIISKENAVSYRAILS